MANALYPALPPEIPAEGEDPFFDLWYSRRLINDSEPLLYDVNPMKGPSYFSPTNVRKLGRR